MGQRFIMTAFGQDRPGIVADVTEILFENGCNLEDTSMSLLAGEFTLILLFTAPGAEVAEPISQACRRLEREKGISAFLRPIPAAAQPPAANFLVRRLHVEGLDQAGIVYKVSRYLASQGINIVQLTSRATASPESGTALYVMDIRVQFPSETVMGPLEEGLSRVADELNVDIRLADEPA